MIMSVILKVKWGLYCSNGQNGKNDTKISFVLQYILLAQITKIRGHLSRGIH